MSRETSPCIIGDYWLDKRRDGASPDIWQIASYAPKSRSIIYRSTKRRTLDLDAAKAILRAHEAKARSKRPAMDDDSELLPHLFHYLEEHGPDVLRLDTVKSSFRAWIGFFMADKETGLDVRVSDMGKNVVARFRRWRMGPHSYSVEWGGKVYAVDRPHGVSAEAVQRNIEDMRSALYHGEAARRFTAPKLPSVDKNMRAEPRDTVLDTKKLGAMMGYAKQADEGAWRWIALMIGTAARPGAALAFDPAAQWNDDIIDLQPEGRGFTDKRNAIVPTIDPLRPILTDWIERPHAKVKSRKQFWETMRRMLGLPGTIIPYTIRHTIATMMDNEGVPGAQMSAIAGHSPQSRGVSRTTAKHYLHYDPRNAAKAKRALTKFFNAVMAEADKWSADHLLTRPLRGQPKRIDKRMQKG